MTPATCANCHAPLRGPYCSQCGQHAHESARSLGALLHEAWHVLTHLDGRLWATLWVLLTRPGRLTREYFAGRRASYLPPFRLYLVISIVFFGLTSCDQAETVAKAETAQGQRVDLSACDRIDLDWELLTGRMRQSCRQLITDHGASMTREFQSLVPKMMFIFLPFMAVVMMLLYLRSHRFYVEHLVFFLHAHAAVYLAIIPSFLLSALTREDSALRGVASFLGYVAAAYSAWYVFAAMRYFYAQSRAKTLLKFAMVGIAYLGFLGVTLLGTLFISALVI